MAQYRSRERFMELHPDIYKDVSELLDDRVAYCTVARILSKRGNTGYRKEQVRTAVRVYFAEKGDPFVKYPEGI